MGSSRPLAFSRTLSAAEADALTLDRHADGSADIVEVRVTDTLEDDARAAEILDVVLSSL